MKKLTVFLVINCLFLAVYAQTTITSLYIDGNYIDAKRILKQ